MRLPTFFLSTLVAFGAFLLTAGAAQAGPSCHTFAKITAYDAAKQQLKIDKESGTENKFFPKTDGAPTSSKLPKKCKAKVLRQDSFAVKPTGGRMSVTQVRANFSGKMLNDTKDENWIAKQLKELIDSGDTVVVLLRQPPGADDNDPYDVTTIYMPITDEELAEIERLNAQAEDV